MGFTVNSFNKSVFNKDSYAAAIGNIKAEGTPGYAVIRIVPDRKRVGTDEDPFIIGVIKEGVNFSIDANWTDMGGIAQSVLPSGGILKTAYEKVNSVLNVGGIAQIGAAFASKKIYQKSEYLLLNPSFRVVDWDGIGQPTLTAKALALYATPVAFGNIKDAAGKLTSDAMDALKEQIDEAKKNGKNKTAAALQLILDGGNFVEGVYNSIDNFLGDTVDNLGLGNNVSSEICSTGRDELKDRDDILTLRSSPVPVTVSIGKFFHKRDMIITSIKYQFSKEMTKAGPLYVDIDLSLSSRKIIADIEDIGLRRNIETSRVFGGNSTGV